MEKFIPWLVEYLNNEEPDSPFIFTKKDVIVWVEDIHEQLLSEGNKEWDGRHYGDCTKQNISCLICMYQNWLDEYEKYCRNFIKQKYESNT